ncbi:hypothetical protein EMIT0P265_20399 [Pseudomonas zeae]
MNPLLNWYEQRALQKFIFDTGLLRKAVFARRRQSFMTAYLWLKCRPFCLPILTDEP